MNTCSEFSHTFKVKNILEFTLNHKFSAIVIFLQIMFIVLFAIFANYDDNNIYTFGEGEDFQNIHTGIIFGIGLLLSFMKRYGYTGLGMNMLLASFAVQTGLLAQNIWHLKNGKMYISIKSIVLGDFAAVSALIALGAIFGKASPLQMVFFTIFVSISYSVNEHFCIRYLKIFDMGEAVALHVFSAFFGLSSAAVLDWKKHVRNNTNESTSYHSNILCMLGTMFLWIYWPSFNSVLATNGAKSRSIINTYLALTGSCACAFAMSSCFNKEQKFETTHAQNSTIAGGVAISTTVDLIAHPAGALFIGATAGILSVIGFKYLPKLLENIVHDPCGIHSLHAIPGIFGGLAGVILAAVSPKATYSQSFYMSCLEMRSVICNTSITLTGDSSSNRSPILQAILQFIYIIVTIALGITTGLLTGFILRHPFFNPLHPNEMYLDEVLWLTHIEDNNIMENNKCNETDTGKTAVY